MATADGGNSAAVDALALGQIERASVLLSEGSPLDLQRAAEVMIDKGQYEALEFLLSNYKLDVDKHFLLHRALISHQENIASLMVHSGANVNNYYEEKGSIHRDCEDQSCDHYSCYLPLQLSLFCSLDMTRFLLKFGADVNKKNNSGETTLVFACRAPVGVDRVVFLLENGANVQVWNGTPLHWAARLGDTEKLILLIDQGADIEAKDSDRLTTLLWACRDPGSVDCLKILLEKGADCDAKNFKTTETALHLAVKSGNSMALKLLIQYGAQLEARKRDGDTALILACEEPVPVECVRILLENGAFPNVQSTDMETPLTLAKKERSEEKIQMLLQYGANTEDRIDQKETNLMLACRKTGNVGSVLSLLQNNASPNVKNYRGETALHIAADTSDIEILKVLVQYKADVNAMTDLGVTPLILACDKNSVSVECVQFLLENKALPNVTDLDGNTALLKAFVSGAPEKLEILVQFGADVNARNKDNETPLILGCVSSSVSVECVKFLLENKALPNVTSLHGETALLKALRSGCTEQLKILVQYGANVNMLVDDTTPLMFECGNNYCSRLESVKFLLENKASPNVTNLHGETALHWAVRSGNIENVEILVKYGANVNARTSSLETPLISAADIHWFKPFAITEIVKLLVKHGADLEARTSRGETPFLFAVRAGNRQLIELLHDLGADVCAENAEGRNAIMLAIETADTYSTTFDLGLLQYLIDKGVSVNHRDNQSRTPLMLAAKYEKVETLKHLITLGADVDAVGTEEVEYRGGKIIQKITALSIALEKELQFSGLRCVDELIRHGDVNNFPEQILHRMIEVGRYDIIPFLLTNGIAPTMSEKLRLYVFGPVGPVSPFTVALDRGNIPLIQYLLGNLMLCPSDIYGHSYFRQWRDKLISDDYRTDVVTMMDEFYSQPKSLFQLSFVTVSHALGGVPGREDRVNSLPLPTKVKDKLLFKSTDVPMGP